MALEAELKVLYIEIFLERDLKPLSLYKRAGDLLLKVGRIKEYGESCIEIFRS